jgi:hypothetical protein
MTKHPYLLLLVAAVGLSITACQTAPNARTNADASEPVLQTGWLGNVYLTADPASFDTRKVFVVSYRVSASGVALLGADVFYGAASSLPAAAHDFSIELVSTAGRILTSVVVGDPRKMIVEHQGNVTSSEGILTVRLAYSVDAAAVRVRDATGKLAATTDLRDVVKRFCAAKRSDPDCAPKDQVQ